VASGVAALSELRPITTMVAVINVLFVGFDALVFGDALLCNECNFPETLLLDVWRLCALQRKIRVDLAAVMVLDGLDKLLVGRPEVEDTLAKAAAVLMELKYGVRGLDDDEGLHCRCGKRLKERIKEELPALQHHHWFDSFMGQCDDVKCFNFQQM
jgi:hypothetical protein